jgi:hypothetical protein
LNPQIVATSVARAACRRSMDPSVRVMTVKDQRFDMHEKM